MGLELSISSFSMRGLWVLLLLVLLALFAEASRPESNQEDEFEDTVAQPTNKSEITQQEEAAAQKIREIEDRERSKLKAVDESFKEMDAEEQKNDTSGGGPEGDQASPPASSSADNDSSSQKDTASPLSNESDEENENLLAKPGKPTEMKPGRGSDSEPMELTPPAGQDEASSDAKGEDLPLASQDDPSITADDEATNAPAEEESHGDDVSTDPEVSSTSPDLAGRPELGQPATADDEAATAPALEEGPPAASDDDVSSVPEADRDISQGNENDENEVSDDAAFASYEGELEDTAVNSTGDEQVPSSDDASPDLAPSGRFSSLAPRVNELYNHVATQEKLATKASRNAVNAFKVMGAYQNSLHDLKQGLQQELRAKMQDLSDKMVNSLEEQNRDFEESLNWEVPQDLESAEILKMSDQKDSLGSASPSIHNDEVSEAASGSVLDDKDDAPADANAD